MSDLIVIGYPDENRAQQVWEELVKLQNDYLVDLEDAAIIRRDKNGKLHITTPCPSRGRLGHPQRHVLGDADRTALPGAVRADGRRVGWDHGGAVPG